MDNRSDHHHGTTTARGRARRPTRPASATAGPQTTRVAIYVRISTDEEHQPFSLEAQTHRLEAFVPTQPGWVHVETYEDRMSGAKADRPDLMRALYDARLGKFDVLLVYRVDRFARSLKVLVHLLEELEAAGVAFRSATEPIDTSTATGRMLVQLLGVFAEFERATIIDRVINGMERKAARGGWPGGTKPFGLTVGEDNLLATTEDFAVVERIFSRYVTGSVGASAVAAELNDDGLRSRNGRRWTPQVVLGILRNRAYLGEVYFRGTWYRSSPEPFVDPEVFDRVQSILDTRGERFDKRSPCAVPSTCSPGWCAAASASGATWASRPTASATATATTSAGPAAATARPSATPSASEPTSLRPRSSTPSWPSTTTAISCARPWRRTAAGATARPTACAPR